VSDRRVPGVTRKVQPRLRVIANGSDDVNARRADQVAALKVPPGVSRRVPPATAETVAARVTSKTVAEAPKPDGYPDARASVFLRLTRDPLSEDLPRGDFEPGTNGVVARKGNLASARLPIADIFRLAEQPGVESIELGQALITPTPLVSTGTPPAPASRHPGPARRAPAKPEVLVGLIDVGGFDFAHPDFLDAAGKTRFVRIWDQGGDDQRSPAKRSSSAAFAPFDYGAELRGDDLDQALEQSQMPPRVSPYDLEPQSQQEVGSHATHVASIAAGNLGVCRHAAIAGVLISIPAEDEDDRRSSFYDSVRLTEAVDYLLELAAEMGDIPVSINISLGTNGHAHDDSNPASRWIDLALTRPGRSVCVAAGNAGQERPEHAEDIGYIMGRIHVSGRLEARDLVHDVEWIVVGNKIVDLSENELELWYEPQDRFAVQVKPPDEDWTEPVEPGQFIENRELSDHSRLSVYNELYHPANGCNYITVVLSPGWYRNEIEGIRGGRWLVRLVAREVRHGRFHGWINRDDPAPVGRVGRPEEWRFPSFFSEASFVDNSTVSSLACGQRVVSVANLDEVARAISVTSSQGPTRDDRQKPDIAAPGTKIVAANGFAPSDEPWVEMSGTSMASPFVAGVVGLMLTANPDLTGAQIAGIVKRTAQPLPGRDFSWRDDSGSGVIDAERCIEEATAMRVLEELK
jgi:subtilisin family serine protease